MANYRVSININNSNNAGQNKQKTRKQRKMGQLRLFKLKHDLLKISINFEITKFLDFVHRPVF
jgi:hypothetical protein